jgi:signal transduction histidine kinase
MVVVSVGWLATLDHVKRERIAAETSAIQQTQHRAMAFEQYVARTLQAADLASQHVAQRYLLTDGPQRLDLSGTRPVVISDDLARAPTFSAVTIVNARGDLLATTRPRAVRPVNVSKHPVFRALTGLQDDRLQISPPLESALLPGKFIYLTRRVASGDGKTLGYVGVMLQPVELSRFMQDASFRSTDLISVIGLDGVTRARREGQRFTAGEDLRNKLVMRQQLAKPNGSYVGPSSIDGLVRYFSHRRLADYPIFVTAGTSQDEALAPVRRRASIYVGGMVGLTLFLIVSAGLIMRAVQLRQRRAQALATANERLRAAQRIARIGDWDYDPETRGMLWSDQLCEMYERPVGADQISAEEFLEYLDERSRAVVVNAVSRSLTTGEPQAYEYWAHLPSGAIVARSAIAVPTRNEQGAVVGLRGTEQDVTSDKELQSLQKQVTHLARVDAMNTMAATLAHELNQPLTAAANYLAGGERHLSHDTEISRSHAREAVALARRQIITAGHIIRRVRGMLSAEGRRSEQSQLSNLVSDAAALLQSTGQSRWPRVRRDIRPTADLVWIDKVQIQQVLVNLLRNACEAAAEVSDPAIRVTARVKDDDTVVVSVSDNGQGIEQPVADLFSPFASAKSGGLGLGLSICRTIVEYHGGKIWVEETGPNGTTISFTVRRWPDARIPKAEGAEVLA